MHPLSATARMGMEQSGMEMGQRGRGWVRKGVGQGRGEVITTYLSSADNDCFFARAIISRFVEN